MAKRFSKTTINWVELEKRVPLEQKGNFFAFKGKADTYLRRVQSNPAEPPKIYWEEYKKAVPNPALVDKLKSAYEQFKVPFPQDTMTAQVDQQWQTLSTEIKAYCDERQKDIAGATKELDRIHALPKFEDMTMEMFRDMYPKLAIDPVNRPTFWPHDPEEQEGYKPPEQAAAKKGSK